MSDFVMMSNLMSVKPEKDILFRDVQVRSLPDSNKTSYSSGQLNFNTNNASQEYWSLSRTDLQVPFTVNVSGVLSASNCLGTVTGTTSSAVGPATVGANGLAPGAVLKHRRYINLRFNWVLLLQSCGLVILFKVSIFHLIMVALG